MQPPGLAGTFAGQLGLQEIGEQAVVAIADRLAVDGRQEQVCAVELPQQAGAVAASGEGFAQRRVQIAQDAGAQQEIAQRRGCWASTSSARYCVTAWFEPEKCAMNSP